MSLWVDAGPKPCPKAVGRGSRNPTFAVRKVATSTPQITLANQPPSALYNSSTRFASASDRSVAAPPLPVSSSTRSTSSARPSILECSGSGMRLCRRLLGRPASESGTLCHEGGTHGRSERCPRSFMLRILYQDVGADVLYAPNLTTRDEIATVVSSVNRPVDVVMGFQGVQLTLAELSGLGVKRVSVGSALYRTAIGAFMRAPQEMQESGSLSFAGHAATPHELSRIMR
jgi:phosphoenolpyruvate phosphomutase-like protein